MSTDSAVQIDEKVEISIEPPKKWKVIFLNDDVTPMELVIDILIKLFKHEYESAKRITLEVHNSGKSCAGVYSYEIAEELAMSATSVARQNGSPLKVQVESE
jgi:ATP-dependent Clp protease adaptor protein ClpS